MADPGGVDRFGILATFVAGRSVNVATAKAGDPAHTNGQTIFVSSDRSVDEQRREMLLQSALLGAGSLDGRLVKALRARPAVARRYLALEGRRVLVDLAERIPLAAALRPDGEPSTTTADESLELARGRNGIDDPPDWFGAIKPARLLLSSSAQAGKVSEADLRLEFDSLEAPEDDDDDDGPSRHSKIVKLFDNPVFNAKVGDFLRKLLGSSRGSADSSAGAEMRIRAIRRARALGTNARPLPIPIRFTNDHNPGAALGSGGALYPEWDVHHNRYRPQWCRVIDFPLTAPTQVADTGVVHDDVLRRRLSRVGLSAKVQRGRPDGEELDLEALIDLFIDLRSGYSPPEGIYLETRKLARDLGVLILLDASGSTTETDPGGLAVHDHQRRTAATLAVTLEELGDRVAVYGFRSRGRHAVHLPAIKTFDQHFDAIGRARLSQLEPAGYTRLGAGIRGAGEILKSEAGTSYRLLVVLSDGFPYDDGYEGRYAEADSSKALEELRVDGVACLCLSIGTLAATSSLERVFGSAGYACAATLADLSPRMDELFLASLQELAVSKPSTKKRRVSDLPRWHPQPDPRDGLDLASADRQQPIE